jgi:hypothetical protein
MILNYLFFSVKKFFIKVFYNFEFFSLKNKKNFLVIYLVFAISYDNDNVLLLHSCDVFNLVNNYNLPGRWVEPLNPYGYNNHNWFTNIFFKSDQNFFPDFIFKINFSKTSFNNLYDLLGSKFWDEEISIKNFLNKKF